MNASIQCCCLSDRILKSNQNARLMDRITSQQTKLNLARYTTDYCLIRMTISLTRQIHCQTVDCMHRPSQGTRGKAASKLVNNIVPIDSLVQIVAVPLFAHVQLTVNRVAIDCLVLLLATTNTPSIRTQGVHSRL